MTHLGPTSRALVAAARGGLNDPDPATAARVRARIAAAIAGSAVIASTTSTTAASATGATPAIVSGPVAGSLAIKLGLVVAIGALVATGVVIERTSSSPAGAPAITTSTITDDEPRGTVHVATPETRPDLGRPGRPTVVPPPPSGAGRPDPVPDTADTLTLAREVELIDRAMAELRLAHFTGALQTIDLYERETAGRGQLGEDAAAIAIEAHCRLHDTVTDMLDVFDRTWPTSAQRTRITAACTP